MKKNCSRCKKEKTLGEFGRQLRSQDGLRSECRECRKKDYKVLPERLEEWKIQRVEQMRKLGFQSRGRKVTHETKDKLSKKEKEKWKDHDYSVTVKKRVFYHYKKKGFEGSLDQFLEIAEKKCFYCGCEPSNIVSSGRSTKHGVGYFKYNGLDRVENEKGYTLKNVVSCCFRCNNAKWTYDLESFKNWIKDVYGNLILSE